MLSAGEQEIVETVHHLRFLVVEEERVFVLTGLETDQLLERLT